MLAIETSGRACSVALLDGPHRHCHHESGPGPNGDQLFAVIGALCSAAGLAAGDLELVAYGCGPGAFSGVRIAAAAAQGLALARGLPLVPVSSLAALAAGAARRTGAARVLCAVDARRGELYTAAFAMRHGLPAALGAEALVVPRDLSLPAAGTDWLCAGDGFRVHAAAIDPDLLALPRAPLEAAEAVDVALLARRLHADGTRGGATAAVTYLRGALD